MTTNFFFLPFSLPNYPIRIHILFIPTQVFILFISQHELFFYHDFTNLATFATHDLAFFQCGQAPNYLLRYANQIKENYCFHRSPSGSLFAPVYISYPMFKSLPFIISY